MVDSKNLLRNKYIKQYSRLMVVILIGLVGGISAVSYHHHQTQIEIKDAAMASARAAAIKQESGPLSQPLNVPSAPDCSDYKAPGSVPSLGSLTGGTNNTCALQCDLTNLTPLLGASKGDLSTQGYQSYVQQMKANSCGAPRPYCEFTPSTPCATSSSDSNGYDAGYSYAEQYQICDPSYSSGKSQEFNDGVNAWTVDNCN